LGTFDGKLQSSNFNNGGRMKSRNLPSRKKIAKYWLDVKMKDAMGNYKDYEDLSKFQKYLCSIDIGEPSCWACGAWDHGCDIELKEGVDTYTAWNKATYLERCHIIPRSMGGLDKPRNLVLLCKKCHKTSPDLLKKKYMKKWIIKQHSFYKYWEPLVSACKMKHLLFMGENIEEYFEYYQNNSGLHIGSDTNSNHIVLIKEFYKVNKKRRKNEKDYSCEST
jgi:hypothetical protein